MDAILNFFNPKAPQQQQKKQQVVVQQKKQQQQKPPENSMLDFFKSKPTKQQVVVQQQQQQKKQGVLDFLTPKQQKIVVQQQQQKPMPPLKERSHIFQPIQQFQVADQVANQVIDQATKDIVKHVQKQTQQSRQQLANITKQQDEKKVEQARKAHQQILEYSHKIRSLLAEIQEAYQLGRIQTQQTSNRLKKKEREAMHIISELKSVLEQINLTRQQTRKAQQSHIRQLQQLKQTLVPLDQKLNRKVVQHITPDGNKMRIQVNVHPDSKCCVANSLSQQSRTLVRLPPLVFPPQ
jgi:hypothetical protein